MCPMVVGYLPTYALVVLFYLSQTRIKETQWSSKSAILPRQMN